MADSTKTPIPLIDKLETLRLRIGDLESAELERQQALAALRESHERIERMQTHHQAVLRCTPHGLCMVSANWIITWLNRAMSTIMVPEAGMTQDFVGNSFRMFFPTEEEFQGYCDSALATLKTHGIDFRELEIVRLTGERFWCEISIVPQDPNNLGLGFVATLNDITRRKRAEAEKAELEEKLRQSQRMEAIGTLAGGVAHDFNNLLTVIGGYSESMFHDLDENDPHRAKCEQIYKASQRAAGLTRQLLAFSRKQVLQPRVLSLNTIIADVSKMLQRLIGEDIEFITRPDGNLGRVKADPGQIEQVLVNLAVNARDAMPHGGQLAIETRNAQLDAPDFDSLFHVEPGPYVCMSVHDTGQGMAPDVKARIFEPFFTTKEQGRGTGLGLSTVYGIVKQSNGYIWVESEVGEGTTFHVYLPRIDQPADASSTMRRSSARGGQEAILLVEDEEMVRELAQEILEGSGYQVLAAANGFLALEIARQRQGKIDLLLTDVVMPQMSGPELARRLTEQFPAVKTMFMSGYPNESIAQHGSLQPEVILLEKPFTADGLVSAVAGLLEENTGARQ